jgi:undecaprenyl diphosphate synthase
MIEHIPHCIGIIMDGNRRWAREQGLPTLEGHKKGLGNFDRMARWVRDAGAKHLAVYALSTENWNRSKNEVSYLMDLFQTAIGDAFEGLQKDGVRLHFVGDLSRFPEKLQENFVRLETESAGHDEFHVWICASYGGRLEVTHAAKLLAEKGKVVTEGSLRAAMWSRGMPDPDIIIRTGGEKRLSNFLLWQAAYSELFFSDTYWPAFTRDELHAILKEYAERERRYGR